MRFFKTAALMLLMLSLALPALAGEVQAEPVPEGGTEIVLTVGGDSTLGSEDAMWEESTSFIRHIAQNGYGYPFKNLMPLFESDDLTIVNFEGVLAETDSGKVPKTYNFRAPTDYANILPVSSIEAVTLGNNHSGDYGQAGFDSTVKALDSVGTEWFVNCPQGNKTFIYEKNGVKVGFLGFYIGYWRSNRAQINQALKELKDAGCAAIVAMMHGGSEYSQRHDESQFNMAMSCIEQGASVVIGHHPHVLQGLQKIKGATIVYSLGNLAFGGNKRVKNMADTALVVGARLLFDAQKNYLGHQLTLYPIHPSGTGNKNNNYQPVFATGDEAARIMGILQADTSSFTLAPYTEGKGALQEFVPALEPDRPIGPMDVHIKIERM